MPPARPPAAHLLVTNDFPPKRGGIQSYLWELWRRLPPAQVTVLTIAHPGAGTFDAAQAFRIERLNHRVLLPTAALARRVTALADEVGAGLVVIDPALPLGLLGPRLGRPYAVVLHGAEITVPARLPGSGRLLAKVLRQASQVVSAGAYPAAEARRLVGADLPPVTVIPPGVDVDRFRPLAPEDRAGVRRRLGLDGDGPLLVSVSRLVPRKGMDVLIEAAATLAGRYPGLALAIAGRGRDRPRLERLAARTRCPVRFLGAVDDADLAGLYACADVFAMLCRDRWFGLEQEGFGIVFLEAAACGVVQVAGASGGVADAVEHGRTGLVVADPRRPARVVAALADLLDDAGHRRAMADAARRRATDHFSYDVLAARLGRVLNAPPP